MLQINDEDKLCRSVKSSLIHESCSDSFQAKISIDVQFYKGVKLFYEGIFISFSILKKNKALHSPIYELARFNFMIFN